MRDLTNLESLAVVSRKVISSEVTNLIYTKEDFMKTIVIDSGSREERSAFMQHVGEFEMSPSKTGEIYEDGTVWANVDGLFQYMFPSRVQALEFLLDGLNASRKVSYCMGNRYDPVVIERIKEEGARDDEDGDAAWTLWEQPFINQAYIINDEVREDESFGVSNSQYRGRA